MENASKALIMAAGILIGVLVLSLGVYLFTSFGNSAAQIQKENEINALNKFNSQFVAYQGRKDVTIYEILELANLASENNKYYGLDSTNSGKSGTLYVCVKLDNKEIDDISTEQQTGKIQNFINNEKFYTCTNINISNVTGRVYEIKFKTN